MKSLEIEDSAQVHAAFLVYMDLTEGQFVFVSLCESYMDGRGGNILIFIFTLVRVIFM